MIILNTALKGENTYDITMAHGMVYRVSAYDIDRALDVVADYIEQHTFEKYGYLSNSMFRVMAECNGHEDVREYAKLMHLVECGTNRIYIEVANIREVLI